MVLEVLREEKGGIGDYVAVVPWERCVPSTGGCVAALGAHGCTGGFLVGVLGAD